jgi:hypothetical protein
MQIIPDPSKFVKPRAVIPGDASSPATEKPNFHHELKDLTDNVFIAVHELKRHGSVTHDALIAAVVEVFTCSGFAEDWFPLTELFLMLHHFKNLGPIAIENALNAMHRIGRIDIWWDRGDNPLPEDYEGARPRSGLFRMAVDFVE